MSKRLEVPADLDFLIESWATRIRRIVEGAAAGDGQASSKSAAQGERRKGDRRKKPRRKGWRVSWLFAVAGQWSVVRCPLFLDFGFWTMFLATWAG